jgi:hypothetical protein
MAMAKHIQCKHISDLDVLELASDDHVGAFYRLCERWPWKVVLRKLEKLDRRGCFDLERSLTSPRLTERGRALLDQLRAGAAMPEGPPRPRTTPKQVPRQLTAAEIAHVLAAVITPDHRRKPW